MVKCLKRHKIRKGKILSIKVHKYHGQKGQNGQWSSVQKEAETTSSKVHQYHGQKG